MILINSVHLLKRAQKVDVIHISENFPILEVVTTKTTLNYRLLVEADCGVVACQALHGKIGLERNRIVWPKHGASYVGTQ